MVAKGKDDDEVTHHEPERDVKMTIWEHVAELRKRLVRAAMALFAGAILCWTFREPIFAWITAPYAKAWRERFPELVAQGQTPEFQILAPADAFVNYMQLSLVGGVILAMPVVFYQLWAFISPGLYAREKKYIIPFVLFSSTLFGSGVAFAYFVGLPFTFPFFFSLLGKVGEEAGGVMVTTRPTMEFYLDFAEHMLLAFGGVFEMPLFIGFLSFAGIVTPRQLLRFGRYAVVGAFVVAAIVTPPDISSQIVVAIALMLLYGVSVMLAYVVGRRREEPEKKA